MSITHNFSKEQARQFGDTFGIDWQWSRTIDERDPVNFHLEGEELSRHFPRVRVEGERPSSSSKSHPGSSSKKKNRS